MFLKANKYVQRDTVFDNKIYVLLATMALVKKILLF